MAIAGFSTQAKKKNGFSLNQSGSNNLHAGLTEEIARKVLQLHKAGIRCVSISRACGVHYKTVQAIIHRRRWVCVDL